MRSRDEWIASDRTATDPVMSPITIFRMTTNELLITDKKAILGVLFIMTGLLHGMSGCYFSIICKVIPYVKECAKHLQNIHEIHQYQRPGTKLVMEDFHAALNNDYVQKISSTHLERFICLNRLVNSLE